MADYIVTNYGLINTDELMHYGVMGMKWGKRKSYDPNAIVRKSYMTKSLEKKSDKNLKNAKKQDELYKSTGYEHHKRNANQLKQQSKSFKDLAEASYKKDVFNKTANRQEKKERKKEFKKDLKTYNDAKGIIDIYQNKKGEVFAESRASSVMDTLRSKKGKDYVNNMINIDNRNTKRKTIAVLAGSAALLTGASFVSAILE